MNEGKIIEVSVRPYTDETGYTGEIVRVRDYGRGVPFGIREDGENVLEEGKKKSRMTIFRN